MSEDGTPYDKRGLQNRRRFIGTVGALSVAGLAGCSQQGDPTQGQDQTSQQGGDSTTQQGEQSYSLTLGGSTQGSASFSVGTGLQTVVTNETDIGLSTQTTPGTQANLRLLANQEVDGIVAGNFGLGKAVAGRGQYADQPLGSLPMQSFPAYVVNMYFAARDGSGVETTADMEGKNVWMNPPGSGVRNSFNRIIELAGFQDKINVKEFSRSDAPGVLQQDSVDVIVVYDVNNEILAGWEKQVDSRNDIHAVEMDQNFIDATKQASGLPYRKLPVVGWEQDMGLDEVSMVGLYGQFGWHHSIPEEPIYDITKLAWEEGDAIKESSAIFLNPDSVEDMTGAIISDVPIHPGAAKFFQEEGVWNDEWTTEQP